MAAQARVFEEAGVTVFVSVGGVHGSSMLDPSRASGDVEPVWTAVVDFLDSQLSSALTD